MVADMAREGGNPDIANLGESTRFGAERGPDPSAAGSVAGEGKKRRASIRAAKRRLAGHSPGTDKPRTQDFARAFGRPFSELTVAEIMAIQSAQQAMVNYKAMKDFVEDVDGKQVEKKVEAKVTLADIINGDFSALESEGDEDEA